MPVYSIRVNIPERPKGEGIEVPPFGRVENGSTLENVEMTREQADQYRGSHGMEVKEVSSRKTDADRAEEAREESESAIEDAPAPQNPEEEDESDNGGGES